MTAGCSTAGPGFASAGFGATTVAFESIDGPPETVFKKLVSRLTEEAGTRHVAVVSRDAAAQYRVRGYISAHVQGRKTTLAWIWDVFDAEGHRMMRIAGEVPGAASERAWAAADDAVIGRIAHDGVERLAGFLAAPGTMEAQPGVPAPTAPSSEPNVAAAPSQEGALASLR